MVQRISNLLSINNLADVAEGLEPCPVPTDCKENEPTYLARLKVWRKQDRKALAASINLSE